MPAGHRLSKLLLRQGMSIPVDTHGPGCTRSGCGRQRFGSPALQMTFDSKHDAVLTVAARRDRHDAAIAVTAASSEFIPLVRRLGCLRGIGTLTGFALAVEIGDWSRFTGNTIGSFVGSVPTEYSSGNPGYRNRSPRPATPTLGGCSSSRLARTARCRARRSWPWQERAAVRPPS